MHRSTVGSAKHQPYLECLQQLITGQNVFMPGRTWHMGQSLTWCFSCSLLAKPAFKEQVFGQFEGTSTAQLLQHYSKDVNALFNA